MKTHINIYILIFMLLCLGIQPIEANDHYLTVTATVWEGPSDACIYVGQSEINQDNQYQINSCSLANLKCGGHLFNSNSCSGTS